MCKVKSRPWPETARFYRSMATEHGHEWLTPMLKLVEQIQAADCSSTWHRPNGLRASAKGNLRAPILGVRRSKRLKHGLEFRFPSGIDRVARTDKRKDQRCHTVTLPLDFPKVDDYGVKQLAGKRHVLMLHYDKREENRVSKQHACDRQNRNNDLSEPRHFPVPFSTPAATK